MPDGIPFALKSAARRHDFVQQIPVLFSSTSLAVFETTSVLISHE